MFTVDVPGTDADGVDIGTGAVHSETGALGDGRGVEGWVGFGEEGEGYGYDCGGRSGVGEVRMRVREGLQM